MLIVPRFGGRLAGPPCLAWSIMKIGSTPETNVIAVTREGSAPVVLEMRTISPGFNSARVVAGKLSIIR